ncbi:pitrilysin family protein [Streptomyces sp. yr375]|uniref:M16 family metallopeptidase n=1 Tax=Streptomyces sp. yr375 TaxID=1761906 RepID=UPI0015A642D5|nr:insulinase family protein [Streptomyces sp. yr375]
MSTPVRLIAVDRPGALAAVRLTVRVGSADERPGEHGVAHVVEHLVVRCLLAGGRVGSGALVDARTGREHTGYSVLVRRADAPAAVRTLAAAFGELRVPSAVLDAELAAIRQETAQRTADVRWRLQEALLTALWADTSYAHSPLGDRPVLDALTADDVRRFHALWYRPSHATAVIVANRPTDVLTATAEAWPKDRTGTPGQPPGSAACGARPATPGVCLELPTPPPHPTHRTVGLAFTTGHPDPHLRTCQHLARRAIRAAGGLDIQVQELRGLTCVWAMLSAPDTGTATRAVHRALRRTRDHLLAPDGETWLRAEALIPELRTTDDPEATAIRATAAPATPPETVTTADVAAVTTSWERHIEELRHVGDAP